MNTTGILTEEHRPAIASSSAGERAGRLAAVSWLGLASVLLLFANGRETIALAAWLAPVFLLRFVRVLPPVRGLLAAWLALAATWTFQFRGMVPVPRPFFLTLAVVYGFALLLPFAIDRALAGRVRGVAGTLVFPLAWVTIEYLQTELTPYGSWGAVAYTQHESLVLLQLVSVTGIYGLTFLIAWFAAVCNHVWEQGFEWRRARASLAVFGVVGGLVVLLGGARLAGVSPAADTVRVASLSKTDIELFPSPEAAMRAVTVGLNEQEAEQVRQRGTRINDDLLERSEREAEAGAAIIFWAETNAFVFKEDEPALLRRASDLARRHEVYFGLAAGVFTPGEDKPLENKLVLIDPEGEVRWSFLKARPVPGGEAAIAARDDGKIKLADTPHGRLGGAICFDMDFPGLLRQAGRGEADIMIVPSNDWREIDPWHTHMARVRAVEQGFNMIRHASNGLSLAADYQGRVLASMDHFTTDDRVLVSRVPTRGVRTVYSRVGDLFAWACMAGLFATAATGLRKMHGT